MLMIASRMEADRRRTEGWAEDRIVFWTRQVHGTPGLHSPRSNCATELNPVVTRNCKADIGGI